MDEDRYLTQAVERLHLGLITCGPAVAAGPRPFFLVNGTAHRYEDTTRVRLLAASWPTCS